MFNIYRYIYLLWKTIRAIVILFSSNFFESSFSGEKFIPSYLYLFIKGSFFVILSGIFLIFSWFKATVRAYLKHLLSFLMIRFVVAFFYIYPIRRINIWFAILGIYFMMFLISQSKKNSLPFYIYF